MNGISTKPEVEFKIGAVRAAIWANPRHTNNGKLFNSHKVLLERFYKDGQGNFQSTSSLDTNDIPKAILALKKAYEYLMTTGQKIENTTIDGTPTLKVRAQIP